MAGQFSATPLHLMVRKPGNQEWRPDDQTIESKAYNSINFTCSNAVSYLHRTLTQHHLTSPQRQDNNHTANMAYMHLAHTAITSAPNPIDLQYRFARRFTRELSTEHITTCITKWMQSATQQDAQQLIDSINTTYNRMYPAPLATIPEAQDNSPRISESSTTSAAPSTKPPPLGYSNIPAPDSTPTGKPPPIGYITPTQSSLTSITSSVTHKKAPPIRPSSPTTSISSYTSEITTTSMTSSAAQDFQQQVPAPISHTSNRQATIHDLPFSPISPPPLSPASNPQRPTAATSKPQSPPPSTTPNVTQFTPQGDTVEFLNRYRNNPNMYSPSELSFTPTPADAYRPNAQQHGAYSEASFAMGPESWSHNTNSPHTTPASSSNQPKPYTHTLPPVMMTMSGVIRNTCKVGSHLMTNDYKS